MDVGEVQISPATFVSPAIYGAMGGHCHYAPDYDRIMDRLVPLCGAEDGAAKVNKFRDFWRQSHPCPTCQGIVLGVGILVVELLR